MNGKRGKGLERGPALREGKTLKVESQERYRDEISPERFRGAEAGESVRNAAAGAWQARKACVKRIPGSGSAEGKRSPGGLSATADACLERGTVTESAGRKRGGASRESGPYDTRPTVGSRFDALEGRASLREEHHSGL